jgi:hypothetical protein
MSAYIHNTPQKSSSPNRCLHARGLPRRCASLYRAFVLGLLSSQSSRRGLPGTSPIVGQRQLGYLQRGVAQTRNSTAHPARIHCIAPLGAD